jgi:hypothetical protein
MAAGVVLWNEVLKPGAPPVRIRTDKPGRTRCARIRVGPRAVIWLCAQLLAVALLAGCGGSLTSTASSPSRAAVSVSVPSPAGCGRYCLQAGVGQASTPPGYPCPRPTQQNLAGCLTCPPAHCMELLTTHAQATSGIFVVTLVCNLSAPCSGAFLLCLPTELCGAGSHLPAGFNGRVAASDFVVPAKGRAAIAISLTSLGQRLVAQPGGYRGDVLLDLHNYGDVTLPIPPAEAPAVSPTSLVCVSSTACAFAASVQLAS